MYENLNIAVIGDIMLDHWREGTDYKLNPESPTIDITNPSSEYTLGGAGNVARIIRSLGARVQLLGVLGEFSDYSNSIILDLCTLKTDIGFYPAFESRGTTVKERIVCDGQQICRISEENTRFIDEHSVNELIGYFGELDDLDAIIVADYSKGVMSDGMVRSVIQIAQKKGIPTLVDPKNRLYIYKGCTIMKPNEKEWEILHDSNEGINSFFYRMDADYLVITSDQGMKWWSRGGLHAYKVDAHPVEVANVSGCGDAAAAVMALEYVRSDHDIEQAVKLANWAASRVVQRERTGHLEIDDLEDFINERGDVTKSNLSGQRRSNQQTISQC